MRGQKAALVINLYYEEERRKAKGSQGTRTDIVPDLEQSINGRANEALVINLYYEEERRKAKERQVASGEIYGISKEKVIPNLDEPIFEGTTNEILATKSGVGKSNIAYLIAVKKKRPDLFEKVFNG